MQNKLKTTLKEYVLEELKRNSGPQGLDLSFYCADQVTENVFGKIGDLVKKESTFEKQWKIIRALTTKKRSRPKPKKVKVETETVAALF